MNEKHREVMEDLKAAKPRLPSDVESWGEGERAKQILAQILATEEPPEKRKSRRTPWTATRIAWGALVVVLVGAAAFLSVHFLAGSGRKEVSSHPTVTTSTAAIAEVVTTQQALEQIVVLVEALPSTGQGQSHLLPGKQVDPVLEGRLLGLLTSTESSSIQLDQPATRRQFALWLWRGFHSVLPEGSASAKVADLASLSAEEQQAVRDLVRDGVIQLPQSGVFGGDQVLTLVEESALLARVKRLVPGPTPS